MLTEKKKKALIVDPREANKYVINIPNENEKTMTGAEIVVYIIDCITKVNPDAKRFYGWRVERDAILDMIDQGFDIVNMLRHAEVLQYTNSMPYSPSINSPREFQLKFSKLASFVIKEQHKLKESKPNIAL